MNNIITIAIQEVKILFRERVFFLLLGVFIVMTLASSFIGLIATTTTTSIYNASVDFLYQSGVHNIPINPLADLSALANLRNVIIYIFLIGALLAIVIGHRSFIRERKSGTLALLLIRPISPKFLFLGKVLGICLALFGIIATTFSVSVIVSFLFPFKRLVFDDILKLGFFYGLSFFYLLFFAFLGLLFAIKTKSESLALFAPVCIWVGISFVLPELVSGQTPTALLNPITMDQTAPVGTFFALMQQYFGPISLGGQYTSFSSQLLDNSVQATTAGNILWMNSGKIVILFLFVSVCFGACFCLIHFYVIKDEAIYE
jgi:ABC-type transport system involved in multi-copper enzyme maturation permease subunit